MIDFHCHIDLFENPEHIVQELASSGAYVLSVTTTPKAFLKTARLAKGVKRIRTSLGLHPQLVAERSNELSLFDVLLPETRYVGEIGIDGGKEFMSSYEDQNRIFSEILSKCSQNGGKIISIHSRYAATAVLDHLEQHPDSGTPILHWFSGSSSELERAIELGCWFSVGRKMVNSKKGRSNIRKMPQNKVLTETDAPFADTAILSSLAATELGLSEIWKTGKNDISRILKNNLLTLVS